MDRDVEQILRKRWPHLYALFTATPASKAGLQFTDTPEPAPIFNGLQLCGGYDRMREARMQATLIPENAPEATVYGIVTETLPKLLLARPSLSRLHIVVLNLSLTFTLLTALAESEWLEDPRVALLYGGEETHLRFPFTTIPPCLQRPDASAARIADLAILELSTYHLNRNFKQKTTETLRVRIDSHLPYILQDEDVAALFATRKGRTLLVAGAGPTLSHNLPLLRLLHREHELIAVDAALSLLIEQDIIPEYVVTIDTQKTLSQLFSSRDERLAQTKLVYFPAVETEILSTWKGKRYTAYTATDLYADYLKHYPKGTLFSAGSVIHPSIDLGVRMGAATIMLFGADFSFPDAATHAEGCLLRKEIDPQQSYRMVTNGNGELVCSQANLIGYLRDLELYIERHPCVRFVNTSREGAAIKGATYGTHAPA